MKCNYIVATLLQAGFHPALHAESSIGWVIHSLNSLKCP